MPVDIIVSGILVIMMVGAVLCLEMKDILSSIVMLAMVGLCLSLSFLILQAPDLALAQFIYEILILGLAFIIMNTLKPAGEGIYPADSIQRKIAAIFLLLIILFVGYFALRELPFFGTHQLAVSEHYISEGARETGVANLPVGIALGYRVYDTFGEAIVIFTGILGSLAIIRNMGKEKA